jgi:hypothetical protein
MKAPASKKKFFFLVSATIVFHLKADENQNVTTVPINATIYGEKDQIPSAMIGKAQQAVQMQLLKRLGEEFQNIEIDDVVINNIITLGYMTEDEFLAPPKVESDAVKKVMSIVQGGAEA